MPQLAQGIQVGPERPGALARSYQDTRPLRPRNHEPRANSAPAARVSISRDAQQVAAIKEYVRQLFEQQGIELKGDIWDEMSVEDAQAAIAEGGEWSAEAVADRIIGFVAEVSGGDPQLKERLREAVQQGFDEARRALGGWLPEVSERTYELVMQRFDEAFKRPEASSEAA